MADACTTMCLLLCPQVLSWFIDRYLHVMNKARFIMPKHGVDSASGMSTLDVQRAKMAGKIPGRLNRRLEIVWVVSRGSIVAVARTTSRSTCSATTRRAGRSCSRCYRGTAPSEARGAPVNL